jgi:hypothetical protein
VVLTWFYIPLQGIAPTLIIVRLGLGISAEDAHTSVKLASGIQFENRGMSTGEAGVP